MGSLKQNRVYWAGILITAGGLSLLLWTVLPAIGPLDDLQQMTARIGDRAIVGVGGIILTIAGFALMAIGSPSLEAVSWNAAWETASAGSDCSCGASNPEDAKFCNQCGTRLPPRTTLAEMDGGAPEHSSDTKPVSQMRSQQSRQPEPLPSLIDKAG